MRTHDLLTETFDRVAQEVRDVCDGLEPHQLEHRPGPDANTIAWLVWHLARVQDAQVAALAGSPEVWTTDGWARRFGLSLPDEDTGYGHTSDDVAAVRGITAELLVGYHDAVVARSREVVADLGDDDLDRVVDESWDPPVTVGVRLVSILADDLQHAGQAAYVRGLVERR